MNIKFKFNIANKKEPFWWIKTNQETYYHSFFLFIDVGDKDKIIKFLG